MEYKICILGVQNLYPMGTKFSGIRRNEMGYCTQFWSTVGNLGMNDDK